MVGVWVCICVSTTSVCVCTLCIYIYPHYLQIPFLRIYLLNKNSLWHQISTHITFTVICGCAQSSEIFKSDTYSMGLREALFHRHASALLLQTHSFCGLVSALFSTFLFVISLFKMHGKHVVEEICSVPRCKKTLICLLENICFWDKL